ncbi:tetratricopeptide repeat protein [Herbaspirillum rhizosphaerae]|uniref:tetratricopeptide repeat protein n=1 Tax=Herbaspirillum rhizosphaerae TaxID=346179 RepID=UPI001F0A082C|nr:tetratricopeptide repeat protein [Herbaspirillum rhizosphaerae]
MRVNIRRMNNDAIAQAYLYFQHGQLEAAHAILQPLTLGAADFNLLHLSGAVAAGLGLHDQAIDWYVRALALKPGDLAVSYKLGRVFYEAGRRTEALSLYLQLIASGVQHADIYVAAALLLQDAQRNDEALQTLEHALRLAPQNVEIWYRHAVALGRLQRHADALQSIQQAISLAPNNLQYRLDLALTQYRLHRNEDALLCIDQLLSAAPDSADAWACRAAVLSRLCRYEESIACSEKALALQPGDADSSVNLALTSLTLGMLGKAWPLYESRWQGESADPARHQDIPRWNGSHEVGGKTILLWAEQGLGDTIHFCRYAQQVAELGAQVVLEVPATLEKLIETLASNGRIQVIAAGDAIPRVDLQLPLMSLPGVFNTTLETIPSRSSYLHADTSKQAQWQVSLTPKKHLRVGIVCSGNAGNHNDRRRSIPLEAFGPLLVAGDDIDFILLQPEIRQRDEAFLQAHPAILWPAPQLRAFDDTAALIANLDCVIGVDTAAIHLAGALGVPVWVLLSKAADWRWFLARDDSPWYPSARLFRQDAADDWNDVISRVRQALTTTFAQAK